MQTSSAPPGDLSPENPDAFFSDPDFPRGGSHWDWLRHWAHSAKRPLYALLAVALGLSIVALARGNRPGSVAAIAQSYFARFASTTGDWRYRIGPTRVTDRHLRRLYPTMAGYRLGPAAAAAARRGDGYAEFVSTQVETDLLVHKALAGGVLESAEARAVLEHEVRRLIAEYYVFTEARRSGLGEALGERVTDAAVRRFVRQNKAYYDSRNLGPQERQSHARAALDRARRDSLAVELRGKRAAIVAAATRSADFQLRGRR